MGVGKPSSQTSYPLPCGQVCTWRSGPSEFSTTIIFIVILALEVWKMSVRFENFPDRLEKSWITEAKRNYSIFCLFEASNLKWERKIQTWNKTLIDFQNCILKTPSLIAILQNKNDCILVLVVTIVLSN